jgi:hypothetical protein
VFGAAEVGTRVGELVGFGTNTSFEFSSRSVVVIVYVFDKFNNDDCTPTVAVPLRDIEPYTNSIDEFASKKRTSYEKREAAEPTRHVCHWTTNI